MHPSGAICTYLVPCSSIEDDIVGAYFGAWSGARFSYASIGGVFGGALSDRSTYTSPGISWEQLSQSDSLIRFIIGGVEKQAKCYMSLSMKRAFQATHLIL